MAVTASTLTRSIARSLDHGRGIFLAKATASGAEDVTFDLTDLGLQEAPLIVGSAAQSAAGGATVGVKSISATSLVVTTSAAATVYITFDGKRA